VILLDTDHVSVLRMPPRARRDRLVARLAIATANDVIAVPVVVTEKTIGAGSRPSRKSATRAARSSRIANWLICFVFSPGSRLSHSTKQRPMSSSSSEASESAPPTRRSQPSLSPTTRYPSQRTGAITSKYRVCGSRIGWTPRPSRDVPEVPAFGYNAFLPHCSGRRGAEGRHVFTARSRSRDRTRL
jgi:hypothetical protein